MLKKKDIGKYMDDIHFETKVHEGVFWVPIHTLGKTRYTNEEMHSVSEMPMEARKKKIHNLYEAVQLFQISDFRGLLDNIDFWTCNTHWQMHKTQEEAVLSNEGCCATDTNWLFYFLDDCYQMGSFCYANEDGNGHITTYIWQDDFYYFIDMMMCRRDSQEYLCEECGERNKLLAAEWAGFLYKCKNPIDFCKFYIERFQAKERSIPYCFYMRDTRQVTATGCRIEDDGVVTFFVPSRDKPFVVYKDNHRGHRLSIVDMPVLPVGTRRER